MYDIVSGQGMRQNQQNAAPHPDAETAQGNQPCPHSYSTSFLSLLPLLPPPEGPPIQPLQTRPEGSLKLHKKHKKLFSTIKRDC